MVGLRSNSTIFISFFQYLLSSGKDSLVKLWELNTSRCLIAYTGAGTTGLYFVFFLFCLLRSKNQQHSQKKNWSLQVNLSIFPGKQEHKTQAVFNHTEDFVMFPDEATTSLCAWNSRNASRKHLLSLGILSYCCFFFLE